MGDFSTDGIDLKLRELTALCVFASLVLIFLAALNAGYKDLMKGEDRLEIPFQRILCMVREGGTQMYLQGQ